MNQATPTGENPIRPNALQAIIDLNCDANRAVVQRTRRILRDNSVALKEQRRRRRRDTRFALAALLSILVLLAPVIWNGLEDLLSGERIGDLSTQAALLLLMVTPAMLAALIAVWKERRDVERRRRDL